MKRFLQSSLLIGILLTGVSSPAYAQDIDANRMNRDLRIMENILGELFKTQYGETPQGSAATIVSGLNFRSNNVRGTYLPGFGVIFDIKSRSNMVIYETRNGSSASAYFYYNSEGSQGRETEEVTEEAVVNRIAGFLKDYGSTIGQLSKNDKILVIYGANRNANNFVLRVSNSVQQAETEDNSLPTISVSVQAGALAEYRRGELSGEEFMRRLETATSEDKEYLDLQVMSNIFETAFDEMKSPSFRTVGGVDYIMLENFGALYSMDVRFGGVRNSRVAYQREFAERLRQLGVSAPQSEATESEDELWDTLNSAYDSMISNTKEYIVDYGRTLSSLDSDQFLLVSLSIPGRYEIQGRDERIPERVEIQVSKSVLEQLDRGRISREEALEQVNVTEY